MNDKPLLRIENLSIGFQQPVLSGVSFAVNAGQCVAIVGESGSGKSLTSLAVMGLLPPTASILSGSISFFDTQNKSVRIDQLPQHQHPFRGTQMGMVFQEPMSALNPALTCGTQVSEVLVHHQKMNKAAARNQTIALFKEVDLPRPEWMFDAYPHQLSGGQRQRVVIAMALIGNPRLLIADEPTTALDVTVQQEILDLLRQQQRERNMGMIFISHDLGVVKHLADQVVVLYKGQVMEQGPAKEVFAHPQTAYTKGLLACRPTLHHKPYRLPTLKDFLEPDTKPAEIANPIASPSTSKPVLLKVSGLNKWYTTPPGLFDWGKPTVYHALKDIDFQMSAGESLGLVGESGSGKSTLGRCIVRLIEPEQGQIFYKGQDVAHLAGKALVAHRRKVQIIFQDPFASLNPRLTIGATIMEPMLVHRLVANKRMAADKTKQLLERVGLSLDAFDKYPHQFSGGQRQRVGIARALAMEPELIVCDESVSALDVSVQAQILNLLNDLKADFGFAYLFISHDLAVVKYMSDRLLVMHKGQIAEQGTATEVYENPQTQYTKTLISSILE